MKSRSNVFLSYSREDQARASALESALNELNIKVWRDIRSIDAGARWAEAIETGIRNSRAAIVLITPASTGSEWVTYEYAFATGAGIPVVAVVTQGVRMPDPVKQFQTVKYTNPHDVAKKIDLGFATQSRAAGLTRANSPTLLAKFKEFNGKPLVASRGKTPSLWFELWLEQVPTQTKSVSFEILDEGFHDRNWTVERDRKTKDVQRGFLTDDMNSYGDVEVFAQGYGRGIGNWTASWRLYEALIHYYRSRPISPGIRSALKQIREN